jgi:hypothetical protein
MFHIIITLKIFNTPAVFQLLQHHKMSQLKAEKYNDLTEYKATWLKKE